MATRRFTDLDLSFRPHPTTGDLLVKRDEQAIKNAIKNLILTNHYERLFHSEVGSSVNKLLFDTPNFGMVAMIRNEIEVNIRNFEPRVQVLDIQLGFDPDNNAVNITIIFAIVNTSTPITMQLTLNRTR